MQNPFTSIGSFVVCALLAAACEGPAGPAGPAGSTGPPGNVDPALSPTEKLVVTMGGDAPSEALGKSHVAALIEESEALVQRSRSTMAPPPERVPATA